MARFAALFDSCSLVSPNLRSILLCAGVSGVYRPLATERSIRSAIEVGAQLKLEQGEDGAVVSAWRDQKCSVWIEAFRDYLVEGYEVIENSIAFDVEEDRYLVAAAIFGGADVIVTFDREVLGATLPDGLVAQTPDDFLCEQFTHAPDVILACVAALGREHPLRLDLEGTLAWLAKPGLTPSFAAEAFTYLASGSP